jgi:hypothetical protein
MTETKHNNKGNGATPASLLHLDTHKLLVLREQDAQEMVKLERKLARAEAQRDALLEALRGMRDFGRGYGLTEANAVDGLREAARAAIASAEQDKS